MRVRGLAPRATLDYETRSACNIKTRGGWAYSVHPSTEILCLVFRLPYWEEGRVSVWHPAFPTLGLPELQDDTDVAELWTWIHEGGLIEAHNSFFEFCIWRNIQVPRHGWPAIPHAQWRCSAAKAAAHALPRGLEDAAKALWLRQQKDVEGYKLMLRMSKPRKARKAERLAWAGAGTTPPRWLYHESPTELNRLIAYCVQDVLTEEALSLQLPDLSPDEQQMFEMDLRMNERGFQIDREAVTVALNLINRETIILNQELSQITQGVVRRATQRQRMMAWFEAQEFPLPDTQKATLDAILADPAYDLQPHIRRALEVIRSLGRSSTAKYRSMKSWMARDGRVRGGLLYHGASTGRWSGKGVQPHNFPKGGLFDPSGKPVKVTMDDLWIVLKRGHRPEIRTLFRTVMEALATALRGAITATRGHQLYVADYAAIEARVLLWLAGDEDALQVFRDGRDIYCEMAESIYHYPCSKDTPKERGMGKIAILGLGYQMGPSRFVETCAMFGIEIQEDEYCLVCDEPSKGHRGADHAFQGDPTLITAVKVVDAYRTKHAKVKQLWEDQEHAAIEAVQTLKPVVCGRVTWVMQDRFLYCVLPSGRRLAYPYPRVKVKKTPWGEAPGLTFMGVDAYTRRWKRQTTYGGMIVENITQAVARDLMAYAMLRAQGSPYQVILSVHDELVAEAPEGAGDVHEFEQLMAQIPEWAEGCPVDAEGWRGFRYHK